MVQILSIYFLQLILPLGIIVLFWRNGVHSRKDWWIAIFYMGALLAYMFVATDWSLTSIYLKYPLVAFYLIVTLHSYRQVRKLPKISNTSSSLRFLRIILSSVGILLMSMLIYALSGYITNDEPVALVFPLKGQQFVVSQGGSNFMINHHSGIDTRKYAVDIVAVDQYGFSFEGLIPEALADYEIFGAPLYSPMDGVVVTAYDHLEDLIPPDRDRVNPEGNLVGIQKDGITVYMAHLKQGSLLVKEGDFVSTGDPIGSVGNTGDTGGPHLHIHAEKGVNEGEISGGESIPVFFDGRFQTRNSLMDKRP